MRVDESLTRARFNPSDDAASRPTVRVLIPIWGSKYVELFCSAGLPALMAGGNLPLLSSETSCEVVFLTTSASRPYFDANPACRKLEHICATSFLFIDDLIDLNNYGVTLTLAYARGIKSLGDRQAGCYFIFLNADFVLSNNSFAALLGYMRRGFSAVMAPSLRCNHEDVLKLLVRQVEPDRNVLDLAPRRLVEITLEHLHATTAASIVNRGIYNHSAANQFFWEVDDQTLIGRFFLLFMLCIRVETPMTRPSGFCDYTFVPDLCPSGNFAVIKDSDELFLLELQAERGEVHYLVPGSLTPSQYAKRLSVWTTREHRAYAAETIVFHAGELPEHLHETRRRADEFMTEVIWSLSRNPTAHRNHRYWVSALAGIRGNQSILPLDVDWPRRLRFGSPVNALLALFKFARGKAPFVGPLHPEWLDYRALKRSLRAATLRAQSGLYIYEGESPVDRLAGQLSCIRRRLQLEHLIDGEMEANDEIFDFCLISCTNRSMDMAWSALARAAPRFAPDARVIMFFDGIAQAHRGDNLLPEFVVGFPRRLPLNCVKKVTFVGAASRFHFGNLLSNVGRRLTRWGLIALPWALLRAGYVLIATGMVNLANVLHSRARPTFCATIVVELTGGWSDPSWRTVALRAASRYHSRHRGRDNERPLPGPGLN